jgi:hypothetical protein
LPFGETTYKGAKQLVADIDAFNERVGTPPAHTVSRIRVGIADGVVTKRALGCKKRWARFWNTAKSSSIWNS